MKMTNSTMRITKYGFKEWRSADGDLHREGGPAREWANGAKEWWFHGKVHCTNGPAVEWDDGTKLWFVHGLKHRTDGPAVEYANGRKAWWVDGRNKDDFYPPKLLKDGRIKAGCFMGTLDEAKERLARKTRPHAMKLYKDALAEIEEQMEERR